MKFKIIQYISMLLFFTFSAEIALYSRQNIPEEIPDNLFTLAKESILNQFKTNEQKSFGYIECTEDECGIIVRLLNKKRERGCIGFVKGISSFEKAVKAAAVNAAFFDARYRHISKEELNDLEIEITIIGRLELIKDCSDFLPGKHSVYIEDSYGKAVMQAQIAAEKGWDREDFLKAICRKAGSDEYCYRNAGAKIYRAYTVFKRKRFGAITLSTEK